CGFAHDHDGHKAARLVTHRTSVQPRAGTSEPPNFFTECGSNPANDAQETPPALAPRTSYCREEGTLEGSSSVGGLSLGNALLAVFLPPFIGVKLITRRARVTRRAAGFLCGFPVGTLPPPGVGLRPRLTYALPARPGAPPPRLGPDFRHELRSRRDLRPLLPRLRRSRRVKMIDHRFHLCMDLRHGVSPAAASLYTAIRPSGFPPIGFWPGSCLFQNYTCVAACRVNAYQWMQVCSRMKSVQLGSGNCIWRAAL
ncbi:hypothetical protein FB451DRAFT_426730, partial [Mycena latifolia]